MTVLPYVTVAIIIGLGSLDAKQARALGFRVGVILVLIWTVAIAMVVLFPLMFPQNQNASFFSAALVEERETFDFLGLYIPTNPFNSLANNVVPSVVLFSVVVGAALIANPHKRRLLDVLDVAANAISKATNFIVQLTPYGVFAIAAVVAGTLRIEELQRLQVYLITYVAMSLLISLWVLPGLVATLTPVPYRALMSRTRDALVLAFMTTSLFAVLPLIIEETKALLREYANVGVEQDAATDVIVPATFNFPHTGKLLSLSFILFAGWFADRAVPVSEYPRLAGTGLLVLFGNVNAAIPYLLDLFRIPADTFRLFVASGIVNARFGTLVAAVHTLAIAVLGTCAVTGTLRVDARKLVRFAIVTGHSSGARRRRIALRPSGCAASAVRQGHDPNGDADDARPRGRPRIQERGRSPAAAGHDVGARPNPPARHPPRRLFRRQPAVRVLQPPRRTRRSRRRDGASARARSRRPDGARADRSRGARRGARPGVVRPRDVRRRDDGRPGRHGAVLGALLVLRPLRSSFPII